MTANTASPSPALPLRRMVALLDAATGGITAYAIIRIQGLVAGDLLYNPDTLPTAPVPYFRWMMFAAWAALMVGAGSYWLAGVTDPGKAEQRLRYSIAWLALVSLAVSLAQYFLIHHFVPVIGVY